MDVGKLCEDFWRILSSIEHDFCCLPYPALNFTWATPTRSIADRPRAGHCIRPHIPHTMSSTSQYPPETVSTIEGPELGQTVRPTVPTKTVNSDYPVHTPTPTAMRLALHSH